MAQYTGWIKRAWQTSGLSVNMLLIMFKCALAPTAALCLLLNDRIAQYFGFVGYLTAILAINPILPQAQYLELMIRQLLSVSLACAATLLELFSVVKARESTSPPIPVPPRPLPGTAPPPVPYNFSASAVAGIWLVVLIFAVCYVRSAQPQLTMPCINFSVVVVVTSGIAPTFPTVGVAVNFAKQLYVINLTGLAMSIAVNMIVWPSTNRKAFKKGLIRWKGCIERCLAARAALIIGVMHDETGTLEKRPQVETAEAPGLEIDISTTELLTIVDQMQSDLTYARRELSVGRLDAYDLSRLQALLYEVLQPVLGLMSGADYAHKCLPHSFRDEHKVAFATERSREMEAHNVLLGTLDYSLRKLGLESDRIRNLRDEEEVAEARFTTLSSLESRFDAVLKTKGSIVDEWRNDNIKPKGSELEKEEQEILFVVLQSQELLHAACDAAFALAKFANSKSSKAQTAWPRLITPSLAAFRLLPPAPKLHDAAARGRDLHSNQQEPKTNFQGLGRWLRKCSGILRSSHAGFGLRIACAVLCSQILAYLHQTQRWYNVQRVVWTSITIAVVTVRTMGQSAFGVMCQVAGTLAGCLLSLLAWYIVDRKIPGVLPFYLLGMMLAFYPAQRSVALLPFTMVTAVTLTLLVGYTLESVRIGKTAVVANGQPYYPPYLLSWIDLLAILAGVGIAFFWTIFPYPILESDELRNHLSDAINMLIDLHLRTHGAVYARIKDQQGTEEFESTRKENYLAVQLRFIKILANLRQLLGNSKYQIQIGGHFPRPVYAALLNALDSIFRSTSLVFYATRAFDQLDEEASKSTWMQELRRHTSPNEDIERQIISILSLCALAIRDDQPLPPFLDVPDTSGFLHAIKGSSLDLLDAKYALEPGYSALATVHASAFVVTENLRDLVKSTRDLTGTLEFKIL